MAQTKGMIPEEIAIYILSTVDPDGMAYWRYEFEHGPSQENPRFQLPFTIRFFSPVAEAYGASEGVKAWQLYKVDRSSTQTISSFYPLQRFYSALLAMNRISGLTIPPTMPWPQVDNRWPPLALLPPATGANDGFAGYGPFYPAADGALLYQDSPWGYVPAGYSSLFVSFRLRIDSANAPRFVPLTRRNPRKWGRALKPKWDEQHKQLVAHRKFDRNTKRMTKNPNAGKFGKAGSESWKAAVYQKAKDVVADAAMAGLKEGGKQVKKKAGAAVFDALKKAVQSKLNKAKR